MLPRSRVVSALLIGIGLALLVWGLVTPRLTQVGENVPVAHGELTYTLTDDSAKSLAVADAATKIEPVERQLHVVYTSPITNEEATARIGLSTRRTGRATDLDGLLSAEVYSYRFDRMSGEALTPATVSEQLASPVATVDVDGLWFAFPPNAEADEYPLFDATLRAAKPAVKSGEAEVDGRYVVTYRQEFEPQAVGEPDAMGRVLYHGAKRDIDVDKATGMIVGMDEAVEDYYLTGEQRDDVLLFNGTMSQEDKDALMEIAENVANPTAWKTANWIAAGIGAVVLVLGALGIFGVFDKRRKRHFTN
ncbi:DUF3068 domain-containing protein [Corynebacterium pyruviciproducens]|uniref:DUF3068 domain-containing protein n=1 Tax=Corynebacterium pyruviciproducens TaxID=598660 RepID=A0AAF0YQP8_9CORY|nr:DUF3068 domain-containing protein [Corynebacterium pyruviciproducens]MDK6566070.1 DUF3068 domain-containing protein [Corynebacterium pyruviciproducens]MDK7213192.1 DUF3068 domain-containing protein [Corynebacterium pyruviciproducens]WOT01675.1 DUF3068 domain-containing protein [Corynebacterium pyruviciproducens]